MKKIKNSFGGILIGLIMIIGGTVLLWWNEGNNVRNIATTNEVEKQAKEIKSDKVDSKNEGKLVLVSDNINVIDEQVEDTDFSLSTKTAKLDRNVEVYQWIEESSTDDEGDTTYTYKKDWVLNEINSSSNFNNPNGHENPTNIPYKWINYTAKEVKIGEFYLTNDQINRLTANTVLSPTAAVLPEGYTIDGNYVTNTKEKDKPEIGDIRITWKYNNWKEVTILAVQKGNSFTDFVSKKDKSVNRVEEGRLSLKDVVAKMKSENKFTKWMFRIIGIFVIFFGYLSILKPLTTLASFVPILGGIVGGLLGLLAFIVGLVHSLLIITIAWFRFRPILSLILIAVIVGLLFYTKKIVKKNKTVEQPVAQPVEQPVEQSE